MPLLTLRHTWDENDSDFTDSMTSYSKDFKFILADDLGDVTLILKSFSTTFTGSNHGFYAGRLKFPTVFDDTGVINYFSEESADIGGLTSLAGLRDRSIDLRWNGRVHHHDNDVHLLVGQTHRTGRVLNFTIDCAVHGASGSTVLTQNGVSTPLVTLPSSVHPLELVLTFEYKSNGFGNY